ncbi:MAG: hypothetical protein Q7V02_08245 [Methylophilus sp.]|nr:hypothetical protein [Methylophilus sp.]
MANLESKILARELGRLGGFASSWVAHLLPNVSFKTSIEITAPVAKVRSTVASLVRAGRTDPDLPELSIITGSGYMNLNPTIVTFSVTPTDSGTCVSIHAVAKEGLIRQKSAKKVVERMINLLLKRKYISNNLTYHSSGTPNGAP